MRTFFQSLQSKSNLLIGFKREFFLKKGTLFLIKLGKF